MEPIVLNSISLSLAPSALAAIFKIEERSSYYDEINLLLEEALTIASPKIIYKPVFVWERGENYILVDSIKLNSRVLAVNLENIHRVFPFVVTCGAELEEWADTLDDGVQKYWAEGIMGLALLEAIKTLDEHIKNHFKIKKISHLSPGSIDDWKLEEQRPLFELLGDVEKLIGVKLTESNFMIPAKTVSGIRFPAKFDFESCMLCKRKECGGRRAPFNKEIWNRYFGDPKKTDE